MVDIMSRTGEIIKEISVATVDPLPSEAFIPLVIMIFLLLGSMCWEDSKKQGH